MKKYLFGMTAVLALAFTACTKDEPTSDNNPPSSPIVAKWQVTDLSQRAQDSATGGMLIDTTIVETYTGDEMVIDFRTNGDVITTYNEGGDISSDTGYYTFNAPTLKMYESKTDMTYYDEFTVTFSGSNAAIKMKDFYETIDLGGFPLTLKISATINAKKK